MPKQLQAWTTAKLRRFKPATPFRAKEGRHGLVKKFIPEKNQHPKLQRSHGQQRFRDDETANELSQEQNPGNLQRQNGFKAFLGFNELLKGNDELIDSSGDSGDNNGVDAAGDSAGTNAPRAGDV